MQKISENIKEKLTPFFEKNFHLLPPFHPSLVEFCEELSKALFESEDVKKYPDLMALAFWLRKTHIHKLEKKFQEYHENGTILVPRGLAFHIPPSNVDTMFVYSWIISLLTGNGNIIRLPTKWTPSAKLLLHLIEQTLAKEPFETIRQLNAFVSYGHEEEITSFISKYADLRIIWGGDKTIQSIRKAPLNPTGKELVFADRYSFSVIHTENYLQASQKEKYALAQSFFNDMYWFDQAACSSPRAVFWIGKNPEAPNMFYENLNAMIKERNHVIPLGGVLEKSTFSYGQILSAPVTAVKTYSNELTVITLENFGECARDHCGRGLLYHIEIEDLTDLNSLVTGKDQTLTYFGFSPEQMKTLAMELNGKGIDRMVPIGQALSFDYLWDGYDLLQELTKRLVIT